jgi:GNAT superfamily N-acetyltransferase
MITIRRATMSDQATIAEFNRRLAWESERKELDIAVTSAGVAAAIADPAGKGVYYLACDGVEVVGQCQITLEWSDWRDGWFWWFQSVYVRADRRGQGILRALHRHVRGEAVAAGNVLALRLYVERENRTARECYERLGLEEEPYLMMSEKILAVS